MFRTGSTLVVLKYIFKVSLITIGFGLHDLELYNFADLLNTPKKGEPEKALHVFFMSDLNAIVLVLYSLSF